MYLHLKMTAFVYLMFLHQFKWFSPERVSSSILPYFQNITLSWLRAQLQGLDTGKYFSIDGGDEDWKSDYF